MTTDTHATIATIRRYPVKSMGGESLDSVDVDGRGLTGDRWFAVEDGEGRFASAKTTRRFRRRDGVFDFHARTTGAGVEVTDGTTTWTVGSADLDAHLASVLGADVRVRPEAGVPHQDAGAVSLVGTATLDWCANRWDIVADPRRLRVNLVMETDEPFVEEAWIGRVFEVGSARLRVDTRIQRCRTVDVDQDGVIANGRLLRPLAAERDSNLAVYADVVQPGRVSVGEILRSVD